MSAESTQSGRRTPRELRYGWAVLSIVLATAVRWLCTPVLGSQFPFSSFMVAILISAWYGGLGPSLVAVVLGAVCAHLFILPPWGGAELGKGVYLLGVLMYLLSGLGVALLGGAMQRARWRAEQMSRQLGLHAESLHKTNEHLELQVAERAAELRLFVEQAPVCIAMFDREMCYVACSKRWVDTYGRGRSQLLGLCHYDVHPDLPPRWHDIHRRGLAGEVQHCDEEMWVQADGTRHWLRWTVHPWIDRDGQLGGIIIFSEDITKRKLDEELLYMQQQQLALISSNLPGPLVLLDNNLRYAFVNRGFETLFGKTSAEAMGHTIAEVLGSEPAERARPHLGRLVKGEDIAYENYFKTATGEIRHFKILASPVRTLDGKANSFVVFLTDITDLKNAEQALREAKEALEDRVKRRTAALEAANKELEAFSYSVSHDLRAPLRAIDGFSRIVLESYAPKLPEDAQEYLRDIRSNTQQMGKLVDDLLAFARLSRQPIRREAVDSTAMIQSILTILHAAQPGRSIKTSIAKLSACSADPSLLKQVWQNLLGNAWKYTGRRDAPIIEVGVRTDLPDVTYYVKDNGVGFDMRYASKLFGVFSRLHRAEDYEGTGVGLAIVQRIVQRHGGRVWAEAEPDRGATFFFTIPYAVPKALEESIPL